MKAPQAASVCRSMLSIRKSSPVSVVYLCHVNGPSIVAYEVMVQDFVILYGYHVWSI